MRFADPTTCPACGATLDGQAQCAQCGVSLTSAPMRELWQTLLHADSLLDAALAARPSGAPTPTPPRREVGKRFADPADCPACRGTFDGTNRCPTCGIDLASPQMRELWQTLLRADVLLAEAGANSAGSSSTGPSSAGSPSVAPPPQPQAPTVPPPSQPTAPEAAAPTSGDQPDPFGPPPGVTGPTMAAGGPPSIVPPPLNTGEPKESNWSVGTILLALGAFGLIVAALIFVTRSWDSLGVVGKAIIMGVGTAAVAGLAVWVTTRPLRASAEALWSVVLALVATDILAARGEGLFGLDQVSWAWVWTAAGAAVTIVAAVVLMWGRKPLGKELWVGSIATTIGLSIIAIGVAGAVDVRPFWRVFIGLVVVGLLGLVLRVTGSVRVAWGARGVVAVLFGVAAVLALIELLRYPSSEELISDAHGVPMLVMSLAAVAIGAAVPVVRIPAVGIATVGAYALVTVPAAEAWEPEGGILATAGFAAVPAVLAMRGSSAWLKGIRLGAVVPALGTIFVVTVGAGYFMTHAATAMADWWSYELTDVVDDHLDSVAWWPIALAALALVVLTVVVPRWPEVDGGRDLQGPLTAFAAVGGTAAVLSNVQAPWWVLVAAMLSLAVVAAGFHLRADDGWEYPLTGTVAVLLASWVATANQTLSVAAWLGGALVLSVLAWRRPTWSSYGPAVVAPPFAVAGAGAAADLAGTDSFGTAAVAAAVGVVIVASLALLPGNRLHTGVAGEIAGTVAVIVALANCGDGADASAAWAVAGAAALAIAAMRSNRRIYYGIGGAVLLLIAYVLLVVSTGSTFIEAYTLPLGIAALAGGLWWMVRNPSADSWLTLGAGLALSLLPSVPQALDDPTGLRALLLGLGAVLLVVLGVVKNWQAPFVAGAVVAAAVLLFNIGPYANAAPRVVLIAVVSVLFIAVGVTWEDRVRDGRKIVAYVRGMR